MASSTFISWICHFWARFWLNFNFGDFRAYFGYFSLVKIDFFEIYFQSWRIKLRVLKFFRPILIIKRHQKTPKLSSSKNLPHDNTLYCSWEYSPNEDSSKYFLKKSNIGNWMISFYMFLPTCRVLYSMPRWLKKDPRVENANQGALGFPVVLAMLADQTAFNLGHDFAPGLKEMSNFSPSTLPSHQLDPC